jgi:hypothetical protein
MSRDYFAVADRIINRRWTNIRRRVRQELEKAYQDGLDDAAAVVEEAAEIMTHRVRGLGSESKPVEYRGPNLRAFRPGGLQ